MVLDKVRKTLKQYYGYSSFKEGQEQIINNILLGHDTLGIMPQQVGESRFVFRFPPFYFRESP